MFTTAATSPRVAMKHLKCGRPKPRCAVSVKHRLDFKDIVPIKRNVK